MLADAMVLLISSFSGICTERSHILSSVVGNIELIPDYYQKATLPFVVKETENLFLEYEKRGIVRKL
jgi:m7GpppX diphosphatase